MSKPCDTFTKIDHNSPLVGTSAPIARREHWHRYTVYQVHFVCVHCQARTWEVFTSRADCRVATVVKCPECGKLNRLRGRNRLEHAPCTPCGN